MSAFRTIIDLPFRVSLPADSDAAVETVLALIEASPTVNIDGHDDALVRCDGRFFMIIWGAGRDLVEVSSFAADERNPLIAAYKAQSAEWPLDAGANDFDPYRDEPVLDMLLGDASDFNAHEALSIEYYMDEARLQATGVKPRPRRPLRERPGISRGLQMVLITITVAFLITVVGALASDDSMERCQLTASFDTCFTTLNR